MLEILSLTFLLLIFIYFCPLKTLWTDTLALSFLIAIISLLLGPDYLGNSFILGALNIKSDPISSPLLIMTCWLLPLVILASQKQLFTASSNQQRVHLALLVTLQLFLILAFYSSDLMMFFVAFEAVLTPMLILISFWGAQKDRLNSGIYFLFYTLIGSLPFFIALQTIYTQTGTLHMFFTHNWTENAIDFFNSTNLIHEMNSDTLTLTHSFENYVSKFSYSQKALWVFCMLAFFFKIPLYGIHLWLPKAHTEAPVAGSMILAAVLLKLGGYGMIRISPLIEPLTKELCYPFIVLALWGVIMTGLTCLRQTDLKSLIAYSSVGHMGLVTAGVLTQTPWGFSGAMILMIAHGLTSSALFCLANTSYERTHTRTMVLIRGSQILLPLMTAWWFIATLANLAMPPLPNLMGELMILTSTFSWSFFSLILTGSGTLITAAYSLYMFLTTQRGPAPHHILALNPSHSREHLLMALHFLPLFSLILKPTLVTGFL